MDLKTLSDDELRALHYEYSKKYSTLDNQQMSIKILNLLGL